MTAESRTSAEPRTSATLRAGTPRLRGTRRRTIERVLPAALLVLLLLPLAGCGVPRWPVDGALTSPFGVRFRGWSPDLHRGVDIVAPTGTEVRAMTGGRVRFAGTMGAYGRVVWLDHGGDLLSVYAHLSEIRVEAGQRVDAGQVVALSGSSGNASGPHLHFEIWKNGREVDPVRMLGGPPGR